MAKDDNILPISGKYLTDNLKTLYSSSIQQLISDLGREVTLTLMPSTSGCPNCDYLSIAGRSIGKYNSSNPYVGKPYNIPFPDGYKCPVCFATNKIKTKRFGSWRATVVKSPKNINYEKYGALPENVVMTKMVIEAWSDITECSRARIDGLDYVKLSDPTKIGLGNLDTDLKFINCLWKRVI